MKTLIMTAAAVAGIAFNVANAAPLPEAKPDDVGFSQQGLARLDDFFNREIAAKRVPGAVVAIRSRWQVDTLQGVWTARSGKRLTDAARCHVRARLDD